MLRWIRKECEGGLARRVELWASALSQRDARDFTLRSTEPVRLDSEISQMEWSLNVRNRDDCLEVHDAQFQTTIMLKDPLWRGSVS